jgi:hypothetical protein
MARAAGALAVFAFLMALGDAGQIYRLQRWLPLVATFRYPCRYLALFYLATSVLAAIGFALLVRQHRSQRVIAWRPLRPLGIVAIISVEAAVMGIALHDRHYFGPVWAILLGPALICTAATLLALAARGSREAIIGLVLLGALDLGGYGLSYAVYRHTARLDRLVAATFAPPGPANSGRLIADLMRFDDPGPHSPNLCIMAGWYRADGYAGLEPQRRLDYRQLPALRVAGVRWVRRSTTSASIAGLSDGDRNWRQVPAPLPRVRLVTQVQSSDNPARDLAHIDIETTALLDPSSEIGEDGRVGRAQRAPPTASVTSPHPSPGLPPGAVEILAQRPGCWQIRTDCRSQQWLVVAESFHNGWHARLDGRVVPVLRVNGDFMGCRVGPGRNEVVLEFQPLSLWAGRWATLLGIGLLLVLALPAVRLRRRV